MNYFTLGTLINVFEAIMMGVFLFLAFVAYTRERGWRWLIGALIALRIALPFMLSYVQYRVWSAPGHGLTQLFLPPNQSIAYFLLYSWTTFFMRQVLALMFAGVVAICVWALMKYREEAMLPEEASMVVVSALILGWPVALFVPILTLLTSTIALAIIKIRNKEARMSLGLWSLVSCIGLMVWGERLVEVLKLQVLLIGR